jgi:FkbM family methyltransferase
MSIRWAATLAAGPLLRRLPIWWRVRAYARLCGAPFAADALDGEVCRAVAPHNYVMRLRLRDWMERFAAINGIYYELDAIAVLHCLLAPGEIFVDVGGNLGFVSLAAAHILGPEGSVIYVEPNSELVARFRETCATNGIRVTIIEAALGAVPGEVALSRGDHHGAARTVAGRGIRMLRGDEIPIPDGRPTLVKIDVEGFEASVIAGMNEVLARSDTAFLIEITDTWLRQNGSSAAALFDLFTSAGYQAVRPYARPMGLRWKPISTPESDQQYNIVFVRTALHLQRIGLIP